MKVSAAVLCALGVAVSLRSAGAAVIFPEVETVQGEPGSEISIRWLVSSDEAILGYSIALERTGPTRRSVDDVEVDVAQTNFFDAQNLITAGGASRDPFFSVIQSDGAGGLFASTNTDDLSTVLPTPGVNDVLLEVVFRIGSSALGTWQFSIADSSALADATATQIPFEAVSLTIEVVPSPSALALALPLAIAGNARRRHPPLAPA